ncbi:MAG: hypothetical protein Q4Q58_04900 [Thermoplasmata archaeon]|nr:hypothetical protein [Thermoplasmata archaeon]
MNPLTATRFYNKCMVNPDTPQGNILLLRQYREQNPARFLSDEQMAAYGEPKTRIRRKSKEDKDRVHDSDGFSYDSHGNRYDPNGNETGGFNDGGSEAFRGNGSEKGFSDYFGAGKQKPDRKWKKDDRPFSVARSYEELGARLTSFESNIGRTKYFLKVMDNPESSPETKTALVKYRNDHPDLFATDDDAKAAAPVKPRKKGFWSSLWKPQEEFDALTPKKKFFFANAFKTKSRARNTAYGLKVMTNPTASAEDKQALTEVVNENPALFFKNAAPGEDQE